MLLRLTCQMSTGRPPLCRAGDLAYLDWPDVDCRASPEHPNCDCEKDWLKSSHQSCLSGESGHPSVPLLEFKENSCRLETKSTHTWSSGRSWNTPNVQFKRQTRSLVLFPSVITASQSLQSCLTPTPLHRFFLIMNVRAKVLGQLNYSDCFLVILTSVLPGLTAIYKPSSAGNTTRHQAPGFEPW